MEERFTSIDGHRVRYLAGGNGPPIVFLHGLMGYSISWSEVLPLFAERKTVYAPDMLNLGYSERAAVDPGLEPMARRMLAFMDAVGVARATLIGSSHGGTIATKMAAIAADRVASLVLVSPAHPWSERNRWQIRLMCTRAGHPLGRLFAVLPFPGIAFGMWRLYGNVKKMPRGTISGYSKPLRDRRTMRYLVDLSRKWNQDFETLRREVNNLARIPTQLIWGDQDRIVPLRSAIELQQRLPAWRLSVIDGCGHLPYEEEPERFVQIVQSFLDDVA